jgi:GTP cyclohydrolase III
MIYIVVENRKGYGWTEHLTCSEEGDAQKMVAALYEDAKKRGEYKEYKYITMNGNVELPPEKPRQNKDERVMEKVSKILDL